ncbi:MAG: hypothetical protein M3235_18760 [Actinomycetota bacterium]|nr:hypothetical protein [Actinomycetota bacterium]
MTDTSHRAGEDRVSPLLVALAWLWVAVPFGYGLVELLAKVPTIVQ